MRRPSGLRPAFWQATSLARRGRYPEATLALEEALARNECSEAEAQDLQARIYAQQGKLLHAECCWRRAKSLDGDRPDYDRALRRLRTGFLFGPRILAFTGLVVLAGLLVLMIWQTLIVTPALVERLQAVEEERLTEPRGGDDS